MRVEREAKSGSKKLPIVMAVILICSVMSAISAIAEDTNRPVEGNVTEGTGVNITVNTRDLTAGIEVDEDTTFRTNWTTNETGTYAIIVYVDSTVTENASAGDTTTSANGVPEVIYVPDDYAKIQWAVDNASAGDMIIVRDGTYIENVDVYKQLTIRSENGSENCIVRAADSNDHVFEVTADYVNISGFTVEGSDWKGIGLISAHYCNISNNKVLNNCCGIHLYGSDNNLISNNLVLNNSWGISLHCSTNNRLVSNVASSNRGNERGDGINLFCSNNNVVSDNTVLDNADAGIQIMNSSEGNIVTNNTANLNNHCGINVWNSNGNMITNNTVSNNNWSGISLHCSNNNVIYINNLVNNRLNNVYSYNSTNIWNSTSKITYTYNGSTYTNYLGNYWSDYNGSDADGDGIGDTPHSIDSDEDNYPLMAKFENYVSRVKPKYHVEAFSVHSQLDNNYWVELMVDDPNQTIQSVNVTGPGINGSVSLVRSVRPNQWWSEPNVNLSSNPPPLPLIYTFTITDKAGTTYEINDSVQSYVKDFATNLSPKENQTSISRFSWTGVDLGEVKYQVQLYDENWSRIWDSPLTNDTHATYDGPVLTSGNYQYFVAVSDKYGDQSLAYETFNITAPSKTAIFDTGSPLNPYPSISGTFNGTITPSCNITATKLYTYPCEGTGGHTEYARIWNATWNATAHWYGYAGDWHNITFDKPVILLPDEKYNYTIMTGSYPQIHHNKTLTVPGGEITCTSFVDANGKVYYDRLPAIRLWS